MDNKVQELRITIQDFIQMDIDIDVYDNVCEELGIAFCGPLKLTDEGKREFSDIMDYSVIININYSDGVNAIIDIEDDPVIDWRHKLHRVKLFFESAAGWCSVDDYKKWFLES